MKGRARAAHHSNETSLALFDEASQAAAGQVIGSYSTSFGMGAKLLPPRMRTHIASIYAMVRIADEIVDTYQGADAGDVLDRFEAEVHRAMAGRFSADVIAHAFGLTARATGIDRTLVDPFFASMRMDLTLDRHDAESYARYIYGSAEVIGEMCLAVFLSTPQGPGEVPEDVRHGARQLGSAYQKINFLRDLGADVDSRGRVYFPGLDVTALTDADVAQIVAECRTELAVARGALAALPTRPRGAVLATVLIYEDLIRRIEATDARRLARTRVSVPRLTKITLAASALRTASKPGVAATVPPADGAEARKPTSTKAPGTGHA
ncbi:phytoene/squalene synthase family protein [Demequina globuliformis]|uniref:phytoene/squalene synthase family protein n=1 Tax=Demequina globuliformis TaxID=676202 RepID=UPI0007834CDB|nr:squalene/phytoene synthase family protein [Demequina globuliformis]